MANPVRGASVLLAFRAKNVRSFRDEIELSLLSTRLAEEDVVRSVTWREGEQAYRSAARGRCVRR